MEELLKSVTERHEAEVFKTGEYWIVSKNCDFWNYYPLMSLLETIGFKVGEGVDLNGEDVLVVSS